MQTPIQSDDFDAPDEEDRLVASRRLFMYSPAAITIAAKVEQGFVNHPDFKACLEACDRVFQLGRELRIQQGVIIVGPPGVGKTAFIRYFRSSLPKSDLFDKTHAALAIRLPSSPNVGHLVGAMLRQLEYPFPQVTASTLAIKRDVLIEALRQKGCRLLFIDEAHHLCQQAKIRTRHLDGSSATDCLRELMDEVPLALCLTGTEALMQLREIDSHLESRLSAKFHLREFANGNYWRAFLKAFRAQCRAFDLSILEGDAETGELHKATTGNARNFKRLMTEAVLVAVDAGASSVDRDHMRLAYSRVKGNLRAAGGPYDA